MDLSICVYILDSSVEYINLRIFAFFPFYYIVEFVIQIIMLRVVVHFLYGQFEILQLTASKCIQIYMV